MTAVLAFAAAVCLLPRADADGLPLHPNAVLRLGSARFQTGFYAYGLTAAPDGGAVVACGYGGWATAFDAATGRPRWQVRIGKGMLNAAAYSPDGKYVYLAEQPNYGGSKVELLTIHRRDAATGAAVDTQTVGSRNGGYNSAFDAAGTVVVTAAAGQQLVVYDLAAKKTIRSYGVAQNNWPNGMAASTGGTTVAAVLGQKLYIYDVAAGTDGAEVREAGDQINAIGVSPDGSVTAAVGFEQKAGAPAGTAVLRLYDRAGHKLAEQAIGAPGDLVSYGNSVAFSPDGKRVAVGGYTRNVRVFDAATGRPLRTLAGPVGAPLTFGRDGRALFAGSSGIQVWDTATAATRSVSADQPASDFAGKVEFGPGTVTVTGHQGDDRVTWDWRTGKELGRMPGLEAAAKGYGNGVLTYRTAEAIATRSPDGKRIARKVAGPDKAGVEILDAASGAVTAKFADAAARELVFTADGKRLLVDSGEHGSGAAAVYDAASGKKLHTLKPGEAAQSTVYLNQQSLFPAPVGHLVVMTESHAFVNGLASQNTVRFSAGVYDTATGRRVAGLSGTGMLASVSWSEDGTRVVVAGNIGFDSSEPDAFFGIADPATGKWVLPHTRNRGGSGRPALSPDAKVLAVGTDDGIQLWEAGTGKLRAALPGPRLRSGTLAFAPDGRHVLSFGAGQAGLVFDTAMLRPDAPPADPAADWGLLADPDAAKAYAAMARLAAGGEPAAALIRKNLPPVAPPDPAKLNQLLAMLDSPKFADRELAVKELRAMGELATPEVRRTLDATTSTEVRERAAKLLASAPKPTPDGLRAGRAVEVLKWMHTPAAKAVLAGLAAGAEGAALTRDARRAAD